MDSHENGIAKSIALTIVGIGFSLLAACNLTILPSSITVQGGLAGHDGTGANAPEVVLQLTHLATANIDRRLVYLRSSLQDLESVFARATANTGLPFQEKWIVLSLSQIHQRPGSGPVFVDFTGDRGWVHDHVGDLAWVTLRHHEVTIPQQRFRNFAIPGLRAASATVLARVEDDDPVLPWQDTDGCAGTRLMSLAETLRPTTPSGSADCFDMETLASNILMQFAVAVTHFGRDHGVIARRHRLAVIPHLPDLEAPALPGFGFVYQADLEAANGVGTAGFTGTLELSIPISFSFDRGDDGTVFMNGDPLGAHPVGTPVRNEARVTITASDDAIGPAFAEELRSGVSAALRQSPFGAGLISIGLAESLGLGGNGNQLPADFSVLVLPRDLDQPGAPSNVVMSLAEISVSDIGGFAPNNAGVGVRTLVVALSPGVRLDLNLNAAGTRHRVLRLPVPVEELPVVLVLLR